MEEIYYEATLTGAELKKLQKKRQKEEKKRLKDLLKFFQQGGSLEEHQEDLEDIANEEFRVQQALAKQSVTDILKGVISGTAGGAFDIAFKQKGEEAFLDALDKMAKSRVFTPEQMALAEEAVIRKIEAKEAQEERERERLEAQEKQVAIVRQSAFTEQMVYDTLKRSKYALIPSSKIEKTDEIIDLGTLGEASNFIEANIDNMGGEVRVIGGETTTRSFKSGSNKLGRKALLGIVSSTPKKKGRGRPPKARKTIRHHNAKGQPLYVKFPDGSFIVNTRSLPGQVDKLPKELRDIIKNVRA